MTRRTRVTLLASGATLFVLFIAATLGGRGGRGYFSPDTLECRTHPEWLIPVVDVPLYRGPSSTHRWPLTDYLVAEGYWSASNAPEPRWLPTFQWNQQWRDGQSQFHCELGRRGEQWIEWSKRHPDLARALWPRVLTALRRTDDGGMFQAAILLRAAQVAPTVSAFEEMAEEIASQRW